MQVANAKSAMQKKKASKCIGNPPPPSPARSDLQRVRMKSGEGPIGAAKGKQSDTQASCQPPPTTAPVQMVHVTQTCPWIATVKGSRRQDRCKKKCKKNAKEFSRQLPGGGVQGGGRGALLLKGTT